MGHFRENRIGVERQQKEPRRFGSIILPILPFDAYEVS
jgi:hypothetical protein